MSVKPPDTARERALMTYANAHDRFADKEQIARAKGDVAEAVGAHRYALWALRAYRAELDDPKPAKR